MVASRNPTGYTPGVTRRSKHYQRPDLRSGTPRALDPARAARLHELARAHFALGTTDAAADVLRRAIVLDPLSGDLRIDLGSALYKMGAFDAALKWLDPLAANQNPGVGFLRGQILIDMGKTTEAILAFHQAIEADPGRHEVRLHLAAALIGSGNSPDAIAQLDTITQTSYRTRALTLRAAALLESSQPESALTDLNRIPEAERTSEHVLLTTRAELALERPTSQIDRTLKSGIERFPGDLRLRMAYGQTLASRRGIDPGAAAKAAQELERLVDLAEAGTNERIQAEAWFLLGELASEESDGQEKAEECFHRSLAIKPDDPGALASVGSLLLEQGRPGHAMPWLLHSLVIDPDRPRTVEKVAKAMCTIADDEAVARWLGLITSAIPEQAPSVLAHLFRFVQEAGRSDAYEEVRRESHRMKNLVAVLASRFGTSVDSALREQLERLYRDWANFLQRIRLPSPAPALLSSSDLLREAIAVAAEEPERVRLNHHFGQPLIKGDRNGLTDAFVNVIRNAVQASPPGTPVRIATRHREGSGWLEVAVTDHGPGISLKDQRRIFDPGFSTREGGSGLGLSIARRVVMLHGGRISVASAPGGPTTFVIRLPVAVSPVTRTLLTTAAATYGNPLLDGVVQRAGAKHEGPNHAE